MFGNLKPARDKFGDLLEKIEIAEDISEKEFLSSVDFWVYYPHFRLEDEVWEPVLSAMQAGKVVILPHRLSGIYENAAVYASEEDVQELVAEFAADQELYRSQARLGQEFISNAFRDCHLVDRVDSLIHGK